MRYRAVSKVIWKICTSLMPTEAFEASSTPPPKVRKQRPQNTGNTLLETQEFKNFPEEHTPGPP